MSKNSLFCPKKESSITQKVLIEIFFNVIFHLMYMVWLDLDAKSALDTGTPSVEAHKCAGTWKHLINFSRKISEEFVMKLIVIRPS